MTGSDVKCFFSRRCRRDRRQATHRPPGRTAIGSPRLRGKPAAPTEHLPPDVFALDSAIRRRYNSARSCASFTHKGHAHRGEPLMPSRLSSPLQTVILAVVLSGPLGRSQVTVVSRFSQKYFDPAINADNDDDFATFVA